MAKQRKTATKPARRRDKKGGPGTGRRKPCPYCKDKIEQVDYKNVGDLRRFVSERGKIRSRRITGACRRHQSQIATAVRIAQAQEHAEQLNKTVLTISQQAGEDGRLFGSVTTQDIADEIKAARNIEVDRRKIHLDDPIKNVGTYQVVLELSDGVTATVKVMVSEA